GLDVEPPRTRAFVATVQDLAPLRFHDEGELPEWTSSIVCRAARLIAPSRFTSAELQDVFGLPAGRIAVIPLAPGYRVSPSTAALTEQELAELKLSGPFVLRLGGYGKRKNLARALAAWPEIRRRTGTVLALAGPPQPARDAQLAAS